MDERQLLEELVAKLLDNYAMDDILSELCFRAYNRRDALKAIGADAKLVKRWDKIADMLDLATSNVSWSLVSWSLD